LLHRRGGEIAPGNIELIPAHGSRPVRIILDYGLIGPERFCAAAVLVNNGRHDLITQRIQPYRRSLLGHKVGCSVRESVNEAVDCDLGIRLMGRADTEN
jgi:hypothetical protein